MSEVFHSAGVPGATRCSESATGTEEARAVAAGAPVGDLAEQRLALCFVTLESISRSCVDAIELLQDVEDDGSGLVGRLLESLLRAMGAEADLVVQAMGRGGMQSTADWLLSNAAAESWRVLRGQA